FVCPSAICTHVSANVLADQLRAVPEIPARPRAIGPSVVAEAAGDHTAGAHAGEHTPGSHRHRNVSRVRSAVTQLAQHVVPPTVGGTVAGHCTGVSVSGADAGESESAADRHRKVAQVKGGAVPE